MAKKKRKVLTQNQKRDISAPYSDFVSCEEMVHVMYDQYQKLVRLGKSENARFFNMTDYDDIRKERRVKSTLSTMDIVKEKITPICPEIPGVFNVERDWTSASGTTLCSYDTEEQTAKTILGAAIWILDQARMHGTLDNDKQCLLEDEAVTGTTEMPVAWDMYYDEKTLRGMLSLLQNRNADCIGLEKEIKADRNKVKRTFMDLYTAQNMHRQAVDSRKRFESVLS